MHLTISEIRASHVLRDISSPKPSPSAAATSLWVGVLCFLDVALEVCFINGVLRTASAAACAACILAWKFYSCAGCYSFTFVLVMSDFLLVF